MATTVTMASLAPAPAGTLSVHARTDTAMAAMAVSGTTATPLGTRCPEGMKVSESDWSAFLGHLNATLDAFQVSQAERDEVVAFIESTKPDIVEA